MQKPVEERHKNRYNLLKTIMEKGISSDTILKYTDIPKNATEEEREAEALKVLKMIETGEIS